MSNKSSPRSRPSRKAPTSVRSGVRRPRTNVTPPTPPQDPADVTAGQRLRRFLTVVGIPNLVLVLAVIVIAFAAILFAGGSSAALPATIAESWFVLHLVPVTFEGVTLGVLPLLPALGVVALIASSVHRAVKDRVSILDLTTILGLTIVIPLTLSAIAWFMVWDASKVFPLEPPHAGLAVLNPVGLHLLGLIFGMGPTLWKALARRVCASETLIDGAVRALRLMLRLSAGAALVYVALLVAGYQRLGELGEAYPILSALGVIGLIAVCLLYVPNAIVGTLAVLLGGQVSVGASSISLFAIDLVPLPVFPLFAAVPGSAAVWAPVLLLIPFAILVHYAVSRAWDAWTVAATAVFAGIWALIVAYFSSGQLGGYGYSGPVLWLFALLATVWVAVIAGAVWAIATLRGRREQSLDGDDGKAELDDDTELDDDAVDNDDAAEARGAEVADETEDVEAVEDREEAAVVEGAEDTADADNAEDTEDTPDAEDTDDAEDTEHLDGIDENGAVSVSMEESVSKEEPTEEPSEEVPADDADGELPADSPEEEVSADSPVDEVAVGKPEGSGSTVMPRLDEPTEDPQDSRDSHQRDSSEGEPRD